MWWQTGPHLQRRMKAESGQTALTRRSTTFFASNSDIQEFKTSLEKKFGSITRAWRVGLDADASGLMDFQEFTEACRAIGYIGNLRTLWFNLDYDSTGSISLKELDPVAAHAFNKFRSCCTERFGTMEAAWKQVLDQDASGYVRFPEFIESIHELGYTDGDEVWQLFHLLLVRPGSTSLTYADVEFLQQWDDTKRRQAHRKRLPTRWVNRDPGLVKLAVPALTMMPGMPQEDFEDKVALDYEKIQEDFRHFLREQYGTLCKAFDVMDANGTGSLSMVEFQSVVSTVLRYCRPADARRLFLSFNEDPGAVLTWDELGITSQEWINHVIMRRTEQRQKKAQTALNLAAPLGSTPRQLSATTKHAERLKLPGKREDVAFWAPLPRGWGQPPTFEPKATTRAPLSARF